MQRVTTSMLALMLFVQVPIACGDDDDAVSPDGPDGSLPRDASWPATSSDDASVHAPDAGRAEPVDGAAQPLGPRDGGSQAIDAGPVDAAPVGSRFCGDALRDPALEECDDGPGEGDDSCSASCRARSMSALGGEAAPPSGPPPRLLGTAPHVAAGGDSGAAVVLVEDAVEARVLVQRFDPAGTRIGTAVELSAQAVAASVPAPAVAALPAGKFAVAWTDLGMGIPDVALSLVDGRTGAVGEPVIANATFAGPRQDADLIWTGSELVVAWTDLFDVYVRRFDAQLTARTDEQVIATGDALEAGVSLEPFAEDVAIAWYANVAGVVQVRVMAAGAEFWSAPELPSSAGDRPALAALDDRHLLLVYSIGEQTSAAVVPRLRAAVLALDAPGQLEARALELLEQPATNGALYAQRRPRAARVGDRVYIAWESEGPQGATGPRTVHVQEIDRESRSVVEPLAQWHAPLEGPDPADAANPALAASPLFPEGALIATWEDHGGGDPGRPVPDVMVSVRPSPIVTLAP